MRTTIVHAALVLALVAGCSSPKPEGSAAPSPVAGTPSSTSRVASTPSTPSVTASSPTAAPAASEPAIVDPSFDEIANVLFSDRGNLTSVTTACPSSIPPEARIRCLYDERYRGDTKAASLAHELWVKWRIVAGVESAHTMDGGYRGMIRIEPAVPLNAERKHLEWIVTAMRDFDQFFAELARHGGQESTPAAPSAGVTPAPATRAPYRFKPITLRFMRSVAARTPSAYAHDWTVAWNLAGSLHTSPDAVRETLFHEIFHLNDVSHAPPSSEFWSFGALGAPFDAVVKRCGAAIPCLGPFTPNETIVRGGTYYSFQPGNGVREYAAELALRYYREQRATLRALPKVKPFKCGPPENARAWGAMRDEYFAGIDAVPPC